MIRNSLILCAWFLFLPIEGMANAVTAGRPQTTSQADALFHRAMQELNRGDTISAIIHFQDCANHRTCNDSTYYLLGRLMLHFQGDTSGYLSSTSHYLRRMPDDPETRFVLALRLAGKRHVDAPRQLKSCLAYPAWSDSALVELIKWYGEAGPPDSLLHYSALLLQQRPQSQKLLRTSLALAFELDDRVRMESFGQRLLSASPRDPLANRAMARVRASQDRLPEARQHALLAGPIMIEAFADLRIALPALAERGNWNAIASYGQPFADSLAQVEEGYWYGLALGKTGKHDEGARFLEALMHHKPFASTQPLEVASVLIQGGRPGTAKPLLLPAARRGDVRARILLSHVYEAQDSLLQAAESLRKVLDSTSAGELHRRLAELELRLNQGIGASSSLETLMRMDPGNDKVARQLYELYRKYGRKEKMHELLDQMLSRFPKDESLRLDKVRFLRERGELDSARALLAVLSKQQPGKEEFALELSRLSQQQGDYSASRRELERGLQQNPGSRMLLSSLVALPASLFTGRERIALLEKALAQDPHQVLWRKEMVSLMGAQKSPGERYIEELIELHRQTPSDVEVLRRLVEALLAAGRLQDAIPYLETQTRLEPDVRNLSLLADAYLRSGRPAQAAERLESAYSLGPSDSLAKKLHDAYHRSDREAQARDFLTRHTARQGGDAELLAALSSDWEEADKTRALELASRAFAKRRSSGSAFQYARLQLEQHGKLDEEIWKTAIGVVGGDSLLWLHALRLFHQGEYSAAAHKLQGVGDWAAVPQARSLLMGSLAAAGKWKPLIDACAKIPVPELTSHETYLLAEALLQTGKHNELLQLSHQRMRSWRPPEDTLLASYAAFAHFERKEYTRVLELFTHIPLDSVMLKRKVWSLGFAAYSSGNLKLAVDTWEIHLPRLSHWDSIYVFLSRAYGKKLDDRAAERVVDDGLSRHPTSEALLARRGELHLSKGELQKAALALAAVDSLHPGSRENHKRTADLLLRLERPDEALRRLAPLLQADPEPDVQLLAARAALQKAEWSRAARLCEKVQRQDPGNPMSHYYAAMAYKGLGSLQQSERAMMQYRRLAKGNLD